MNIDEKIFSGKKLKEALEFRGVRMSELARQTGISKQSLSLYCNDRNTPPFENVNKIALCLGLPPEYFIYEDGFDVETHATFFRSQAAATKSSQRSQKIKMEYSARLHEAMLNYVNFPVADIPFFSLDEPAESNEVYSDYIFGTIENIAASVRKRWGVENGPIINLQYLLESHGIVVTGFKNIDSKIDAFSQKVNVDGKDVYVIALALGEKPIERLRFDMAHELGHLILHSWDEDNDILTKEEFATREKQANLFASAFLLPREDFSKDILAYSTEIGYYRELKKKWRVSMQAMMMRSWNLKIITANQYSYMMRQVSKNGWRTKEPGDVPGSLNSTVFQAAIDILIEGGYLTAQELRINFGRCGLCFYDSDLEDLMGLREGTLASESSESPYEPKTKILKFDVKGRKR